MGIDQLSGMHAASAGTVPLPRASTPAPVATAAPATAPATPGRTATDKEVQQAVAALNSQLQPADGQIEFSIDQDSGRTLLKVVDQQTQAVLLQVPSKLALAMAKDLGKTQGVLVRETI